VKNFPQILVDASNFRILFVASCILQHSSMAGAKRQSDESLTVRAKRAKVQNPSHHKKPIKTAKTPNVKRPALPLPDDSSVASEDTGVTLSTDDSSDEEQKARALPLKKKLSNSNDQAEATSKSANGGGAPLNGDSLQGSGIIPLLMSLSIGASSSRESHAKQKVLVQERKAAKPNADSIARSKKIWERLRRKSHVPKDERKELVTELFDIITGRVKDFVFKHDSVRVIQTALKYANMEQRRQIGRELKGEYRTLAESRYAKFLIAKLVVGDDEIRDMVIPEFYGHVKRLIRHPEAAWIMDDIYRTIATPEQKSRMLREWYGHEFAIFQNSTEPPPPADLHQILAKNPEKRGPVMQHLKEMTNQLVQKKTTGFTMLHDALLQYFINCTPGSPEVIEVIEMLKADEEGDCLKNLAFTKSGARLVCLALAYGNSKDRRAILKVFKGVVKLLGADVHGHCILLTAFDVIDDTVMTAKVIFPELLGKDSDEQQRQQELLFEAEHLTSRIPLLYLLSPGLSKWLLSDQGIEILQEVHEIRKTSSKKEPQARRQELVKTLSEPLIDVVSQQTEALVSSSFGCQFINEVIFRAVGDKTEALQSLASLAKDKPELMNPPHAGRMLKSLVQGGPFDKQTKQVQTIEPPLKFESILYAKCRDEIVSWATGPNSFVVVAMLESPHMEERDSLIAILRKKVQVLQKASQGADKKKGNTGAQLLLQKIGML
jgi:pumilio homology domain family member 6